MSLSHHSTCFHSVMGKHSQVSLHSHKNHQSSSLCVTVIPIPPLFTLHSHTHPLNSLFLLFVSDICLAHSILTCSFLFFKESGLSTSFALVLFIDYKEMTRSKRDCCDSCPSSVVPCLFLSACCPISIDNRNLSIVCEGRRCVCVFGSLADK